LPEPLAEAGIARLAEVRVALVRDGVAADLVDALLAHVREGDDDALSRMRPRALARTWNRPERDVISAFLHATRAGLCTLSWDAVCPHCRGDRAQLAHLGDIPKSTKCDVCDIEFETKDPLALEVTFHVHSSVRAVERRMFCSAEPARKPHIFVQRLLAPRAELDLRASLPAGRYRLRTRGGREYTLLDVRDDATESEITWRGGMPASTVSVRPGALIKLQNSDERAALFVIESRDEDHVALRPADLFAMQDFRDLFSEEAIAADMQLDVGQQTILFTDVVGSTQYYDRVGDAAAFAEVRRHFREAWSIVSANGGVVVKTIGDAVMAAFSDPASAIRASIAIQRFFDGDSAASQLRLRITVHAGRCLAVNLNSGIDYFGSTVNLAAKLQSIAGAGEIAFTAAVHEAAGVRAALDEAGLAPEALTFEMKWCGASIPAYRVKAS
jgi:class 3 adenylate cyclase